MNFLTLIARQSRAQINKLVSRSRSLPKVPLIENNMPEKSPISIEERHQKAVELLTFLRNEIEILENTVEERTRKAEYKRLLQENKQLREEVELWRTKVMALEEKQEIKQYDIFSSLPIDKKSQSVNPFDIVDFLQTSSAERSNQQPDEKNNSKEKAEKKSTASKKKEKSRSTEPSVKDVAKDIHVGRLDLRVGRIVDVIKHSDADTLYIEQIDVGEEKPRTVVSGLVKHIPIEQMQNRLVIVLCNLKPTKMRGVLSEAMVMCASSTEKVEILNPPENSVPGDIVTCDDFPSEPDPLLNSRKKIFEQVAPDLRTNSDCVAIYKSSILKVGDKGVVKADTLVDVQIK